MIDTTAPVRPVTVPGPRNPGHRNVFADDCVKCEVKAGHLCEPDCPASRGVEFVTLETPGWFDSVVCVEGDNFTCRTHPAADGLYAVRADGTVDENCTEEWGLEGQLVGCGACGRVFSQLALLADEVHVQVLYTLDTPPYPA